MIYAIPPAIRITALGIRGVAVNTVEAATSMGSTRSQLLRKVQLPLARRMILLGVNQYDPLRALDGRDRRPDRRRRARSGGHERPLLESGARNPRGPRRSWSWPWPSTARPRRSPSGPIRLTGISTRREREGCVFRPRLQAAAIVAGIVALQSPRRRQPHTRTRSEIPPRTATLEEWLLAKIQVVLDYVQDPTTWVFAITERVGVFILQQLLLPLQEFLVEAPWFTTVVGAHGDRVRRERPAAGAHHARDAGADRVPGRLGARRWTRFPRFSSPPRWPSLIGVAARASSRPRATASRRP